MVAVVRVPRQPSTKWWILLAAVLAALITWWQHRAELERLERAPAPQHEAPEDLVDVEIVTD